MRKLQVPVAYLDNKSSIGIEEAPTNKFLSRHHKIKKC